MTNVFLFLNLICISIASCSKNDEIPQKGIIDNRPGIAVNESSQISFDESELSNMMLDTTLYFDNNINDSLVKWANEIKLKGHYKGLSFAIGSPGKGFWTYVVGESGTEAALETKTKFYTCSLSKMFTAALVLKFIEERRLNLEDTIEEWFPDCPRAKDITIRHLLCHTSGIQTFETLYEFVLNNTNNYSEQDLLTMAFQYPIKNNPDTYFSYTNTGYVMLGCILQKVSNKNLTQLFDEYFITPLKLKNTIVETGNNLDMGILRGYNGNELSEVSYWPLTYGAGPLISTPTEIVLMYNYLLSEFYRSKESLKLMMKDMNIWMKSPDTYYGKGIYVIKDLPIGDYLGHSGADANFRTCVFFNPQNKIYIAIFSNTNATQIEPAMFYMTEKLAKNLK